MIRPEHPDMIDLPEDVKNWFGHNDWYQFQLSLHEWWRRQPTQNIGETTQNEGMFGLAHFKQEGAPLHPEDCNPVGEWTKDQYDTWYDRQLKRYNDYYKEPFND